MPYRHTCMLGCMSLALFIALLLPRAASADCPEALRREVEERVKQLLKRETERAAVVAQLRSLSDEVAIECLAAKSQELRHDAQADWRERAVFYELILALDGAKHKVGIDALIVGLSNDRSAAGIASGLWRDRVAPEFQERALAGLLEHFHSRNDRNQLSAALAKALGSYEEAAAGALPELERLARCGECDRIVRVHAFSAIISIGGFEHSVFDDPNIDQLGRRYRFAAYTASWGTFREQYPNVDVARLEGWAARALSLADDLVKLDKAELDPGFVESMGQIYWALGYLPREDVGTEALRVRLVNALAELCESEVDAQLRDAACRGREEMAQLGRE